MKERTPGPRVGTERTLRRSPRKIICPVCGGVPSAGLFGGIRWKWMAAHLTGHLFLQGQAK